MTRPFVNPETFKKITIRNTIITPLAKPQISKNSCLKNRENFLGVCFPQLNLSLLWMCLETFLLTMSCLVERMTIGLSHPIGHVAQGGLIAGGFCMPSGLGIVGAAAIERTLCCSGGQNLFQVFWDQEVHFFLGKLGSPLPLWHSLQYIYIHIYIYTYIYIYTL